jgi:hypothetical protein
VSVFRLSAGKWDTIDGWSTAPDYDKNGNEKRSPNGRGSEYNAKDQTTSMTPADGAATSLG